MASPSVQDKMDPVLPPTNKWPKYVPLLGILTALLGALSVNQFAVDFDPLSIRQALSNFTTSKDDTPAISLGAQYRDGCPEHRFSSVKHLSRAPDIMVIEDFLTPAEAQTLIRLADPLFEESTVVNYGVPSYLNKDVRLSWTAYLNRAPVTDQELEDHEVVKCIERRASAFQGHVPIENMEELQVVKYTNYGQFKDHHDWFDPNADHVIASGNRLSSFFVYLVADCKGGETVFPEVWRPKAPEWCGTVRCEDDWGQEIYRLEVLPKVGTAIYWRNLEPSGTPDSKTLHAGAPVINGTKIGLNIWTRERQFRK